MLARRLLCLLLIASAGCITVAGCSADAVDDDAPGADDGDGAFGEAIVSEHQLTGSELPAKTIALTFDDGPGQRTQELAEYLAAEHIHATFFINGKNAPGRQMALKAVVDNGHILANHSQNHLQLTSLPAARVISEIEQTDDVIRQYQPDGPWLFRAPFGAWNAATTHAVNGTPMKKYVGSIFWNEGGQLTSNAAADWDCWGKGVSVERCGALYLQEMTRNGKGISLMHDIHSKTIDMVKTVIVPSLKAAGWSFVALTDVPAIQRAMAADSGTAPSDYH